MDFKDDVKQEIIRYFNSWGVTYTLSTAANSERQALIDFFNMNSKLIAPKPRAVHKSDTFHNKLIGSGLDAEIQLIEDEILRGDNLNPHLSKLVLKPSYNDSLLNSWSIYHLHISNTKDNPSDRFYKRSGNLLFTMVTPTDIYFIDIRPHGENEVFVKQEFLEIVARNWPHLLHEAPGVVAIDRTHSDADVKVLRGINVNIGIHEINGKFYHPPGLGFAGNGSSAMAIMRTNSVVKWIRSMEKHLVENSEMVKQSILRATGQNIATPDYKLQIIPQPPGFTIAETVSGLRMEDIDPGYRLRLMV
ncbi:MAG: hypothetical protein ACLQQ4_18015 [Bacteroidia bacterium]